VWTSCGSDGCSGLVSAVDVVQPAYLWVPERAVSSSGALAVELAEQIGFTLDPEQVIALDALLSEQEDGRAAALENALIAARQNLKTFLYQIIALTCTYVLDARLLIWSAHHFATAMEAFRNLDEIISGTPSLARRVKRVSRANGDEGFELVTGQRLMFKARTKTGGRGLTGDVVILDEAFALSPAEMGSLLPTLSARPDPRVYYGSSAGLLSSDVLRGIRDRGRPGGDPSLVYVEFCAPENACADERCDHQRDTEGCAADDPEQWRKANPALERRISIEYVRAERRALPPEEFVRERLGWWEDPIAGDSGIPAADWSACADRAAALDAPVVLALDVAPGHGSAAIAACGRALHVVDHHRSASWVVARVVELVAKHKPAAIGLDPTGPAGALIEDLKKAGITEDNGLVLLDGRSAVLACESFLASVLDHTLVHRDEHALNAAVTGAGRRQVGDSWKWSRRDSDTDISPLVAATVARYLWTLAPPPPPAQVRAFWA
jgi:hypothetical protein